MVAEQTANLKMGETENHNLSELNAQEQEPPLEPVSVGKILNRVIGQLLEAQWDKAWKLKNWGLKGGFTHLWVFPLVAPPDFHYKDGEKSSCAPGRKRRKITMF